MKHGSRIIAFGLILCMMAGVLCALAVPRAKANPGDKTDLYAEDLREYFLELKPNQAAQTNQFFNLLDTALNPDNNYYVCALFNDGDWLISIYSSGNLSMSTWYSYNQGSNWNGISRQPYSQNINAVKYAYLFYDGTLSYSFSQTQIGLTGPIAFDFNNPYTSLNYNAFPNTYNLALYNVFTSRDIGSGSAGFTMTRNFFAGERPPEYIQFTMQSFKLGERWFLTINEQDAFSYLPGIDEYFGVWYVNFSWDTEPDSNGYPILWENIICIPNGEYFIQGLSNVAAVGVYAYDITEFVSEFTSFDVGGGHIVGYGDAGESTYSYLIGISNSNFTISAESNGQPDSYTETYNNWYNYVNNYPTSAVVPENLGEVLYGVSGTKSYPVTVSVPLSIIQEKHASVLDGRGYFRYHFALNNNSALNYDLLDVCVCSAETLLSDVLNVPYQLRWWYDDSLNPQYATIKDLRFNELFDMYDVILIVSDPEHFIHSSARNYVYTGDSDLGFQYSESALVDQYSLSGFAFVTKKALQKQLLFNFNDGITKTYDLMCQYIEKRDLWDNSFLEWTTTLFTQWQTLDGRLSENGPIYKLLLGWDLSHFLSDIASKLGEIANNTAPDDSDLRPWYQSLWDFLNQFVPSDLEFSAGLDAIQDMSDELPLIPVLSPGPTLPPLPGG